MTDRLTPEQLAQAREWCAGTLIHADGTPKRSFSHELARKLLAELDAVTKERDEALKQITRLENIIGES